jgi:hypothetical protein
MTADRMSEWRLPHVWAYWDERTSTVVRRSEALAALSDDEYTAACEEMVACVSNLASELSDGDLITAAHVGIDDLYKAASATGFWGSAVADYLSATAGTFFPLLRSRGYTVQYCIDNSAPVDEEGNPVFGRILDLFPAWFASCEINYICPQRLALALIEKDGLGREVYGEKLPDYAEEARHVANMAVEECVTERRHFVFLDVDSQSDSFEVALSHSNDPGVISVIRNEAPVVGSKVLVSEPDGPAE